MESIVNDKLIRDRLVEQGEALFDAKESLIGFTKNPKANVLLNDLTDHPHAFVLGCIMDRQLSAEKALAIPYLISEKIGEFSMERLGSLSKEEISRLMSHPKPLHRFVEQMAENFYSGVQRIQQVYAGNAAQIWLDTPSSAEVVYRFLEFDGVGPKISTMAANILARDFKIPFADFYSIDISADVHVRRVFARLGLCPDRSTVEQVIYKARALYPVFPGMMDLPCWEIGRNWCRETGPKCSECYMNDLCLSAGSLKT
jgi:endonuclease-3